MKKIMLFDNGLAKTLMSANKLSIDNVIIFHCCNGDDEFVILSCEILHEILCHLKAKLKFCITSHINFWHLRPIQTL